jgi:hypothetical protein
VQFSNARPQTIVIPRRIPPSLINFAPRPAAQQGEGGKLSRSHRAKLKRQERRDGGITVAA